MTQVIAAISIGSLLFVGCGRPTPAAAEKDRPAPAAGNEGPEESPPTTVEGDERERQQSWKKPQIPELEDIESITAEAYSNILPIANDPPFLVPKRYYVDLLKHFRDAELDKIASPWHEELGTIRIALVGGRSTRICWFWEGQGYRLCFSCCGMRYTTTGERFAKDETLAIDSFVRRTYRIEVLHEDGGSEPMWWPTSEQPAASEKQESPAMKPSDARAAVEALANRNPAPNLTGPDNSRPIFAEKFDWSEDKRVWDAVPALVRHAEEAWPVLVKHLDDDRYCIALETAESGFTCNWTVGDMCREVVARNLAEAYYQNLRPLTQLVAARMSRPEIARDKKKLKAWCEEQSKKKLYDLQIEMCHWAMGELSKPETPPSASPLRLRAWIATIEADIESLQEQQHAFRFRGFGEEEYTPYSAEKAAKLRAKSSKDNEHDSPAQKP